MRNVFDQYEQPENRLTHALAITLNHERRLIIPFLQWLGIREIPKLRTLTILEQSVPGLVQDDADVVDRQGLPDAAIFDDNGWAVFFESKVQACLNLDQVERHRQIARRHGFESPWLVILTVDDIACKLPERTIARKWQEVYSWFNRNNQSAFWARQLVEYMKVFERKMLLQNYGIRGTITVFDGLRFDEDNPYTYREGKRLIRLLSNLLRKRKDLYDIGVDPNGEGRSAITGKGADFVWDFLPLRLARGRPFTSFPHLTIGIRRSVATAAITIPNSVKGGFRRKLSSCGIEGFRALIAELEGSLRPVIKRSIGSKPMLYITQRHYRTQNSPAEIDARLEADLRTAVLKKASDIRYQPQWIDAVYDILLNKRSNIQLGVDVQFRYDCPVVRSPACADLLAESWKALSPLKDFALRD